jgi:hypothetical protein
VLFDPEWRLSAISPRFHFADHDIEICTGLVRRGSELIASFGINDRIAALAVVDECEVLAILGDPATLLAAH